MLRPGFLLFCLYVMCYLTVRAYGEISYQPVQLQSRNGPVPGYVVQASYSVPRWRRQLYRAIFSPLMVVEEEGRRLADGGRGLVRDAGNYGRDLLPE